MNILLKTIFYFKNPSLVVISAEPDTMILDLLSTSMKGWIDNTELRLRGRELFSVLKNNVFVLNISDGGTNFSDVSFLIRRSSFPVLILNGKMADGELLKKFPKRGLVIADNETARLLKGDEFNGILIDSVGFNDRADLWASDLNIGEETNFKINHGGDSVPFWIDKRLEKGQITEILLTVKAGMALGLNLVQISQNLKI